MVLFFTSNAVNPPATIYMGKDKFENEDLLRYGLERDVWFHVDKLSSAHVYLRLEPGADWEKIPEALLQDCAQLVKANSIQGNKKNNLTIIYTPWSNVKKTGDMATGSVTFHNDRKVRRVHVRERDTTILSRLTKTKIERHVDFEEERQQRLRDEGREKKKRAVEERAALNQQAKQRAQQAEERDYSRLFTEEAMAEAKNGNDSDDSFM
ncbi:hypothetical protein ACQY0O_003966 [Thecaphora frezii]